MPDWVTHLSITWIICRGLHLNREQRTLALIGSLLPDLYKIATVYHLLTGTYSLFLSRFCIGLTTPLGIFLLAGIGASFFEEPPFKRAFLILFCAASLHLFLDSLMYPWGGRGTYLLWPFYYMRVGYGLFWPNDLRPMLISGLIAILFETIATLQRSINKS